MRISGPSNETSSKIYRSPQQRQKRFRKLRLAFVNREESAEQLMDIWRGNMEEESISNTSLIVLEQSFGIGKTSFVQRLPKLVAHTLHRENESNRSAESALVTPFQCAESLSISSSDDSIPELSQRLAYHSAVVTIDCRSRAIGNEIQKQTAHGKTLEATLMDAIINLFVRGIEKRRHNDHDWKDKILSDSSGRQITKQRIANSIRKKIIAEGPSWENIDEVLRTLGVTFVLLLDEVVRLINLLCETRKIDQGEAINELWCALSTSTNCSHLIVIPVCPNFYFFRNYVTTSALGKPSPTKIILLMLPPLKPVHIKQCLRDTRTPKRSNLMLDEYFSLEENGTKNLAEALYQQTLGVPRMIHHAIEYLLSINSLQRAVQSNNGSVEKLNTLVADSHPRQKTSDLLPISGSSISSKDLNDFLRLVLLSRARVCVELKMLQPFSDSIRDTGTQSLANFMRRFNVWYSPVRDRDAESESYLESQEDAETGTDHEKVDQVRIVIPAMSLHALSIQINKDPLFLQDTRWMFALLAPEEWAMNCGSSGGPGLRGEIFEELVTRFMTYHALLQPMAQSIASPEDTLSPTWADFCTGSLFEKSLFLRTEPIPTMYQSGHPFPCFGFKSTITQTWNDCLRECPVPHQFWDKIAKADRATADAMYDYVLSSLDPQDDGQWVMLRPRPLSEGPDAILLDRNLQYDGKRRSIQMQIRLRKIMENGDGGMTLDSMMKEVLKILRVTPKEWRTTLLFFWTNISDELRNKFENGVMYLEGKDIPGIPSSINRNDVELIVVSLEGILHAFPNMEAPLEKLMKMGSASSIVNHSVAEWMLRDAAFGSQALTSNKQIADIEQLTEQVADRLQLNSGVISSGRPQIYKDNENSRRSEIYVVLRNFTGHSNSHLSVKLGESIHILAKYDDEWLEAMNCERNTGLVPADSVEKVIEWSVERVAEWLQNHPVLKKELDAKLAEYGRFFISNEVNGKELERIDRDDLRHMGIGILRHYKTIIDARDKLFLL